MFLGINSVSVKSNLLFLLNQHNLNANSLSEATDGILSQPTTRRILNGESENIRDKTLEKYASYFKVPLSILKYGDVRDGTDSLTSNNDVLLSKMNSGIAILNDDDIELPLLQEMSFSAGSTVKREVEETKNKIRFSKTMLQCAEIKQDNAACAISNAANMQPTIRDGATIALDRSKQQIKDGKIYAFDHGGLLRVCRLYRQPYGAIRLVNDNKDYGDEILTAEQFENDVKLLGWVFWWSTLDRWH